MKKKSPPYAIIGAVLLAIVGIVIAFKWKQAQDAAHAQEMAAQQKALQDQIDALKTATPAPAPPADKDQRYVYYATQPVAAGAKLSAAFYEKKLTPNSILPDAFTESTDIVGFYAIRSIEKGDPLTPRNIGKTLPFLTERITPGMRAVSLKIFNSDFNYTGGFVVDGDKVDLLYSTTTKDGLKVNTQLLMQNVDVLYAPGSKIDSEVVNGVQPGLSPGEGVSITFQVMPEQAQALIFLSEGKEGRFSMILRSRRDTAVLRGVKPFDIRDFDFYDMRNIQKKIVDKSQGRVDDLTKAIEAKEKALSGTTNETPNPTPPNP